MRQLTATDLGRQVERLLQANHAAYAQRWKLLENGGSEDSAELLELLQHICEVGTEEID